MLPAGDERPGTTPADLVFIIEEKLHQKFSREGNDLVYNAKLPLVDALCGATVNLTTLDGRPLKVRSPLNTAARMHVRPCMLAGRLCFGADCKPQEHGCISRKLYHFFAGAGHWQRFRRGLV